MLNQVLNPGSFGIPAVLALQENPLKRFGLDDRLGGQPGTDPHGLEMFNGCDDRVLVNVRAQMGGFEINRQFGVADKFRCDQ